MKIHIKFVKKVRPYYPLRFHEKITKIQTNKKFVKRWQFFCSAWLQFHEKNYENSKQTKKSWKYQYDGSSALLDCVSREKLELKVLFVKTWRFCSACLLSTAISRKKLRKFKTSKKLQNLTYLAFGRRNLNKVSVSVLSKSKTCEVG